MEKDQIYLAEIREFCQKVIEFIQSQKYEDFIADEKLQLAIVKLIENIGEASKRLSPEIRQRFSSVD